MICLKCLQQHLLNIKTNEYNSVHCENCNPHFDIFLDVLGKNAALLTKKEYKNEFETMKNILSQESLR